MDLQIQQFAGYELIASGSGRKLERFGEVLVERPSPQAIWPRDDGKPWDRAQVSFVRNEGGTGDWKIHQKRLSQTWQAKWNDLTFEIRLTGFGNVGLFPEHTAHWTWMADRIRTCQSPKILNLFAYTGGASMSCAQAGAKVTHVDAAKSVNSWAIANSNLSAISKDGIRFLADDAVKFVKRELRRNNQYDGIILDPPTFGRGTKGEVWKIERDLHILLELCRSLLSSNPLFVLLTSHSPGVTPSVLGTMLGNFGDGIESGEMLLKGENRPLPSGAFARWTP
jgi:23S rRNA (cytosine1962-C5)-methyltransferase